MNESNFTIYGLCRRRQNNFSVLSEHNVEILRTKHDASIYPKVTIRIKDNGELMELLHDLNYKCFHEVSVVKIKTEAGIIERIKRIFE